MGQALQAAICTLKAAWAFLKQLNLCGAKNKQNEWELEDGDIIITLNPADSEFWALPFLPFLFFLTNPFGQMK